MGMSKANQGWGLLLCMLCGLTVGYFVGNICSKVPYLTWLNYSGSFGLDNPVQVNLGVIWFSLQIKFNITLTAIAGLLISVIIYRKLL